MEVKSPGWAARASSGTSTSTGDQALSSTTKNVVRSAEACSALSRARDAGLRLVMVTGRELPSLFRTFDRVSYALILEITDTVHVGDRFTNPR